MRDQGLPFQDDAGDRLLYLAFGNATLFDERQGNDILSNEGNRFGATYAPCWSRECCQADKMQPNSDYFGGVKNDYLLWFPLTKTELGLGTCALKTK